MQELLPVLQEFLEIKICLFLYHKTRKSGKLYPTLYISSEDKVIICFFFENPYINYLTFNM